MTASTATRVMIVDDHKMVRAGLALLIGNQPDLELVGEASGGAEAIHLCDERRPDIILMDLVMPGMDGVAATRAIRQAHPGTQVIALTSFADTDLVQGALQAGAIGYLLKDISAEELVDAIRAARAGKPTLAWEATQALIGIAAQANLSADGLTGRELEVLALMKEGLTNRQISARLQISPHTVNAHVSNILSKLGVASRTEAVARAVRDKLI